MFGLKPTIIDEIFQPCLKAQNSTKHHELSNDQQNQLNLIIAMFPSSEKLGLGRTSLVTHKIDTGDATPIKQRYFSVSPAVQKEMYTELDRMLSLGVIQESTSPWCSPMALVRKSNGKVRLCLDARKLNSVTKKDAYPLPLIDGLLSRLDRAQFMSSLDLKDAFWQIPLDPESMEKTAFTVPGRPLYHFTVMPFGLCNAPQTLCRVMHRVIPYHLHDRVFVYLDDLLITTSTFDEHLSLLADVASRLAAAGLTINVEKSKFLLREIDYLGHVVGGGTLRPNPDKIKAIAEYPVPKTVRQVRRFLGICGWYRRFIDQYSSISTPLTNLLKKNQKFVWSEPAQNAFDLLKSALTTAPVLNTADFNKHFYIQCDASSTGVGAVLFQKTEDGQDKPIEFMSHKLNSAQRHYSVTELECLAAVLAVKKFRSYVEGLPFTVITDHASLTWLMSQKDLTGRLARWSLKLQGFNFEIEYRKGTQNCVPDALSRVYMDELSCQINERQAPLCDGGGPMHVDLNSESFKDSDYMEQIHQVISSPTVTNLKVIEGKLYINKCPKNNDGETDIPEWKLIVPKPLRQHLIISAHTPPTSAHLGTHKTLELLRRYFFWPNMTEDIRTFIASCEACKCIKAPNSTLRPPLSSLPKTFRPWQRLYLDFLGPYPRTSTGNTSILIGVDHYSKFVITRAVRQATAKEVVKFLEKDIFFMFGVPESIVTDNGRQFSSHVVQSLLQKYGVNHIFTAKYSPQGNSSERVNRTILASIRAYIHDDHKTWDNNLDAVTQALRGTIHESTGYAPHLLVFGQHPIMHGSIYELLRNVYTFSGNYLQPEHKPDELYRLSEKVRNNFSKSQEKSHTRYNLRSRPPKFHIGQRVFVRNFSQSNAAAFYSAKLAPKYLKARITRLIGNVSCEVADDQGNNLGIYHFKDVKT